MKRGIVYLRVLMIFLICTLLNGCALLQVPVTVIDGTFKLAGQLINLASKIPIPPGVF